MIIKRLKSDIREGETIVDVYLRQVYGENDKRKDVWTSDHYKSVIQSLLIQIDNIKKMQKEEL